MALKNNTGNYLKVTSAILSTSADLSICFEIYENETQRRTGLGEFDKTKPGSLVAPKQNIDIKTTDTMRNELLKMSYSALKNDNQFKEWIDC